MTLAEILAARKATQVQQAQQAQQAAPQAAPAIAAQTTPQAQERAQAPDSKALLLEKLRAAKAKAQAQHAPAQTAAESAKPAQQAPVIIKEAQTLQSAHALPSELRHEQTEEGFKLDDPVTFEVKHITTGASMGWYSYKELRGKLEQASKLAKLGKSFQDKAASYELALAAADEALAAHVGDKPANVAQDAPAQSTDAMPSAHTATHTTTSGAVGSGEATRETFSLSIVLNERQQAAVDMALAGKSFCLIGAAGTGKTSTQRAVARTLYDNGGLREINFSSKGTAEMGPSFAAVAFTRRAAANLGRAIFKDEELARAFGPCIRTVHSLLEFEPVYFFDGVLQKETMRFLPRRNADNPLEITHLVIEEASMIGAYDLWPMLYEALPEGVQIIFIGDINQLPPVFGPSILNYALTQLPVVELKEVYRQADGSGILENAHRILKGQPVQPAKDVHIISGKNDKAAGQEKTAAALSLMFENWYKEGLYDPEEDMILSPYNKQPLGTTNLNNAIAQFLGTERQAVVHEVIAGFNTLYLAVGDKVMCDKRDGIITNIAQNTDYMGKAPQVAGRDLNRYGGRIIGMGSGTDLDAHTGSSGLVGYENFDLESLEMSEDKERNRKASHTVTVELDSGVTIELNTAGDFGPQSFSLGYVLTTHKAQGCEWRRVFIILHPGQQTMIFREWLYTAWTRAAEDLYVIAKQYVLDKAVASPRIVGDTIEEKIMYFNSKLGQMQDGILSYK